MSALTCPNHNSPEWIQVLAEANNDEKKALSLWIDKGYDENAKINSQPFTEPVHEELNSLSKLNNSIKLSLARQVEELSNKNIKDQTFKLNRLKRLQANLDAVEGVESINMFIEDAYEKSKSVETRFDDRIKNKDNYTRHELIHELTAIYNFANEYSILDEISQHDIDKYFSGDLKGLKTKSPEDYTTEDKLLFSLMSRDQVKRRFLKEGLPLLADTLLEYKSPELDKDILNQIKDIKLSIYNVQNSTWPEPEKERRLTNLQKKLEKVQGFSLDKEKLIDHLTLASKDESVFNFMLDPLISSADSSAIAIDASSDLLK